MEKYIKIKSKNKCPVCGGNEWYPLTDENSISGTANLILFNPVIDSNPDAYDQIIPVIDTVIEDNDAEIEIHFDQCANCGIVVSG